MVLAFDLDDTLYKEKDYVASAHIAIRAYLKDNYSINDGDSKKIMDEADKKWPQYGFSHHKGYPTKEHYQRIKQYGIAPFYRRSFLKNLSEK